MSGRVDPEALTAAMVLVPSLYSRNRIFSFFADPAVKRAKARAMVLRGAVKELVETRGKIESLRFVRARENCFLHFNIRSLRYARTLYLSDLEAACVAFLATKAGVSGFSVTHEDRALIERALHPLATGLTFEELGP